MSHLKLSHHVGGTITTHNTFLVIFKVHSDSIHLWRSVEQTKKTYSISCHDVETNTKHSSSDIKVFILRSPEPPIERLKLEEECTFQPQQSFGEKISPQDLTIFMTGPISSDRKTSFAFNIIENDQGISRKLGSAYVYLDPDFSSQGAQRTPIVASTNHVLIGQIQVEYIIVTNPVAYGKPTPRPDWLHQGLVFAGHRGAGSGRREDLPDNLLENTIASFNFAHKHGADFCELDVLVSADGIPVVYHDFDVDAVTAHQSSSELGKFRIQVNEFTVKQLRDFRLVSLQDENGHQFTLNVPNQYESNRPFPTLAEVLQEVDETCGLNIEIKWPQMLECGQMEARRYREINDFVERIIDVVDKYAGNRRIVLESFEPDLCIMLRLKQNKFPVIFLTQGLTDKYPSYTDIRTRSVTNGILFAHAFDIAGIDLIQEYYIRSGKKLVEFIRDHNLVPRTWGELEEGLISVQYLKDIGVQCITCDKVDLLLNDSKPS